MYLKNSMLKFESKFNSVANEKIVKMSETTK